MVMKRPMVSFLTQLLLIIRSRFTRRARLEAENLLLRQQLIILRRKSSTRVRLRNIDRLLLVWLCRLYPSLLDAIIIVQPETVLRLSLPKTSFGVTECYGCASGRRDDRVPGQAPACRTIPTEVTSEP